MVLPGGLADSQAVVYRGYIEWCPGFSNDVTQPEEESWPATREKRLTVGQSKQLRTCTAIDVRSEWGGLGPCGSVVTGA